jgi:hypothetical protein
VTARELLERLEAAREAGAISSELLDALLVHLDAAAAAADSL